MLFTPQYATDKTAVIMETEINESSDKNLAMAATSDEIDWEPSRSRIVRKIDLFMLPMVGAPVL